MTLSPTAILNQVSSINILQSAVRESKVCRVYVKFKVLKLKNRQFPILQPKTNIFTQCDYVSGHGHWTLLQDGLDACQEGTLNVLVEGC